MKHSIPQDDRRACLCRDGTYSRKCCGQDYYSQGIGNTIAPPPEILTLSLDALPFGRVEYFTMDATFDRFNASYSVRFVASQNADYSDPTYNDVTPITSKSIGVQFDTEQTSWYVRARVEKDSYVGEWTEDEYGIV